MSIVCGWCKETICSGDIITLIKTNLKTKDLPKNTVMCETLEGKCLVGCEHCAPPDYKFETYWDQGEVCFLQEEVYFEDC